MSYIQNRAQLLQHGAQELRAVAIDVLEHALAAADPGRATRELIHLDDRILSVGGLRYDLSRYGGVYVLGAGKATFKIAQVLDEILGHRIQQGVIAVNQCPSDRLEHIRVLEAGHPIPDERSHGAAIELIQCAELAGPGDLVFAAITGGSSALLCCPVDGISFEEKQQVHRLLLASGADITAINAVRKHLSQVKGGLLGQRILPAELINLTVSDVVGDPLDYISGPTVADTSRVQDAIDVLVDYGLWDRVAPSVREHLSSSDAAETPKHLCNDLVHTFVLVPSSTGCNEASRRARELGFAPLVLTTSLEGESRDAGMFFGSIAKEILATARPLAAPCAVIASGEVTVTLLDAEGSGGPSQELAVGGVISLAELSRVVLASIDTDGFDGPTQYAGGLIDGSSYDRAKELGYDPFRYLRSHNSTPLLENIGDALRTGPTGTNIADLVCMLVST